MAIRQGTAPVGAAEYSALRHYCPNADAPTGGTVRHPPNVFCERNIIAEEASFTGDLRDVTLTAVTFTAAASLRNRSDLPQTQLHYRY